MFRIVEVTLGTVSVDLARMGLALEALSSMSGQSNSFKENTQHYLYIYLSKSSDVPPSRLPDGVTACTA